jgi:hypothetical protein
VRAMSSNDRDIALTSVRYPGGPSASPQTLQSAPRPRTPVRPAPTTALSSTIGDHIAWRVRIAAECAGLENRYGG